MVEILRVAKRLEEFDRVGAPAGDVAGKLLEHEDRAFAPPHGDGVGDFRARIVDGGGDACNRLIADQIADIGDDPRRAGFDELVVVEPVEIVGHRLDLLADHLSSDCSGPRDALASSSSSRA